MEKILYTTFAKSHAERTLFLVVFLMSLFSVQLDPSPETGSAERYCHKTYFIQEYHDYQGSRSSEGRADQGQWHGNVTSVRRLPAETLIAEVNLLHNDLRRERSRRKSLVDFVDSLIRRYSNNSQVVQTWRRYYHKYSVDLPADDNEAPAGVQSAPISRQDELEAENRKSDRRARKRTCGGHDRSETKKINEMKSDITSLKNSYSAIYTAYTQLAASHRKLQRETRRYVTQGERLRMFHLAEMRKLGWALANETDLWHAGVRYLMEKMSCMQEENRHTEICLNLDPSPRPSILRGRSNLDDATGSPAARSGNKASDHNKLSKSGTNDEDDRGKRKPYHRQQPQAARAADFNNHRPLVNKPQHVGTHGNQPLTFAASLIGEGDEEEGGEVPTGGAGVGLPSMAVDYELLRETFTEAGVEVFRRVTEQLRAAKPKDCSEIDLWVQRQDPLQSIYLVGRQRPTRVYCDDGWTVIQVNRRQASSSSGTPAKTPSSWGHFRDGLGVPGGRRQGSPQGGLYWLGNEYLHQLTNQGAYRLRVELGRRGWASYYRYTEYAAFKVKSEREGYALEVRSGTGTAGDVIGSFSAWPLGGAPFATRDRYRGPTQERLTARDGVGWWYPTEEEGHSGKCFTNLNAHRPWFCDQEGGPTFVDSVVMKVRPNQPGHS